jgi:hypothetical protein
MKDTMNIKRRISHGKFAASSLLIKLGLYGNLRTTGEGISVCFIRRPGE